MCRAIVLSICFLGIAACTRLLAAPASDVETTGCVEAGSIKAAPARTWPDYQIIMWQEQTPARLAGLARLGVTAGKILGSRGPFDPADAVARTAPFRSLDLRWYVENIATDFYSAYHRWQPDHPVTWLFDEAQRRHRADPSDPETFIRTPSLSDSGWLGRIDQRLDQHVRAYGADRTLYFSLGDEAGIADLAAAWDFDRSPSSLDGMRAWLRCRYGTLDALNGEWGSAYTDWSAVMPMTTDQALRQPNENFAAWGDFKEWMDVAFSRAVRSGTDAVHRADPHALAGLEGAQAPGWGGYDYGRLADAVDVMEMVDHGDNVELARGLNPNLIVLHTSSLADASQIHDVWHDVLLGGRGLILWDEHQAFVDDAGQPTAQGHLLGTLAAELRSGLAAQLIAGTPAEDPVAILYSPESQRVQWLLDRKADGKPWAERRSETEFDDDNAVRAATRQAARSLAALGVSPQWITGTMLDHGLLRDRGVRVLILAHAIALSSDDAAHIRAFAASGGTVLTESQPGLFDEHGRRRVPLDLPVIPVKMFHEDAGEDALDRVRQMLDAAGVRRHFTVTTAAGSAATHIDVRSYRSGALTIVGLQRDMAAPSDPGRVRLRLDEPGYVYDLRRHGRPSLVSSVDLALDRVEPTVIAITPSPIPLLSANGPSQAVADAPVEFTVGTADNLDGCRRVVHVEARAPDGTVTPAHARNIILDGETATWRLTPTLEDPPGPWTIRMTDVLTGQRIDRTVTVSAAR